MSPRSQSLQREDLIVFDYDWDIEDLERLKQMGQQVHEKEGKFGVRLPIAELRSSILDHPEWQLTPVPISQLRTEKTREQLEEKQEEHKSVMRKPNRVIYCVLSGYGYYLTQAVKTLLEETEVDLLICDRSIVGAKDSMLKGCDAFGHGHYTRAKSISTISRWLFEFADHLHREYPDLQLGITAAAYGVAHPDTTCSVYFDLFFNCSPSGRDIPRKQ